MVNRTVWIPLALGVLATAGCGPAIVAGTGAVLTRSVIAERSTRDAWQDTEVKLGVKNRLLDESAGLFGDVSVDVIEGRVVLTGSVPAREDKVAATQIAWATPGVAAVTDELTVAEDQGAVAYVEDAWISNQLRLSLLRDARVSSVNYNVETVGKVVHLTGLARSRDELARVIDHAASTPGVVKVVSHVLTIDDPRRQARQAAPAGASAAS